MFSERSEVPLDTAVGPASAFAFAPPCDSAGQTFRVIRTFHPWHSRQFEWVAYKNAWGEDRVYFYNEHQQLTGLPATWTDVVPADSFLAASAGSAPFGTRNPLELVRPAP